ncbi:MAG: BlaI/MecI/CopY family transcriptional regulator [Oscillospiraceae bacterium]|nr:BlaI/MecI/CopY family transcriptional regulator [Oscillospiraceae bacterium]
MELTKSEMEIMDVFWQDGGALSRSDLLKRSDEKSWKDSSVHILLNGLLNKGAIRKAGVVKCSKTYGRTFLPTMTREEYFASTIYSHRYKPDLPGLMEALLNRPEVDTDTLSAIGRLLQAKEEEFKGRG